MPSPRPFRNPSGARPVPFRAFHQSFRGRLLAESCGKERAPDHDHGKRRGQLTTCQSCDSSVWYSLSKSSCVDSVCARLIQKNHIRRTKKSKNIKMSCCSAHHTFRKHHATLELAPEKSIPGFVFIFETRTIQAPDMFCETCGQTWRVCTTNR